MYVGVHNFSYIHCIHFILIYKILNNFLFNKPNNMNIINKFSCLHLINVICHV